MRSHKEGSVYFVCIFAFFFSFLQPCYGLQRTETCICITIKG